MTGFGIAWQSARMAHAAKTVTLHVAIEPGIKGQIGKIARAEGLTPSDIVRRAIRAFLEAQSQKEQAV